MKKQDDFFKESPRQQHQDQVLAAARSELQNDKSIWTSFWFQGFSASLAAMVIAIYWARSSKDDSFGLMAMLEDEGEVQDLEIFTDDEDLEFFSDFELIEDLEQSGLEQELEDERS